jgi:hypothetical protein
LSAPSVDVSGGGWGVSPVVSVASGLSALPGSGGLGGSGTAVPVGGAAPAVSGGVWSTAGGGSCGVSDPTVVSGSGGVSVPGGSSWPRARPKVPTPNTAAPADPSRRLRSSFRRDTPAANCFDNASNRFPSIHKPSRPTSDASSAAEHCDRPSIDLAARWQPTRRGRTTARELSDTRAPTPLCGLLLRLLCDPEK